MHVLNKHISAKSEENISRIVEILDKPIAYFPIGDKKGFFGMCCQDDEKYSVWLDESLPDDVFEVNLLHELIHLTQMKKNIPDCKPINENNIGEREFASIINATVLDLEVEEKLKEQGYDTSYFSHQRLKQMKEVRNKGFINYANNEFLQKFSSIRLALYAYIAADEISDQMYNCFYKRYPRICSMAYKITKVIRGKQFDQPNEMFEAMKNIIELLNIGEHVKIVYDGKEYYYLNNIKQWQVK